MNPRIVVIDEWPPPDTVTPAIVSAGPSGLMVGYGTAEGKAAVITFSNWANLKAGGPNDEALGGHPLYEYGLKHYSIHRVENSPWLDELERQNSVHPQHSSGRFRASKVHYIFALKEETVECLVREPNGQGAKVEVFGSPSEAMQYIKRRIDA
jgi:hypothetical protein